MGFFPIQRAWTRLASSPTHQLTCSCSCSEALGRPTGQDENLVLGVPDPMPSVEPEMTAAFENAVSALRNAGVSVRAVELAAMLTELVDAQHTVAFYEGARFHQQRFETYGDRLGQLATMIREGRQISEAQYDKARQFISESRLGTINMYRITPVILVPGATGPAPRGLSYTGDAKMNAPWTALGTPAISIPMPIAAGVPLGLQLTAAPGQDARVLRTAVRVDRILNGKSATVRQRGAR